MLNEKVHNDLVAYTDKELELLAEKGNVNHTFKKHIERKFFKDRYIFIEKQARFTKVPLHSHSYIELVYVYQGEMNQTVNGKNLTQKQGEILLLNQNAKHELDAASENDIVINLIIKPEFLARLVALFDNENIITEFVLSSINENRKHGEHIHFKVGNNAAVQRIIGTIIEEIYSENLLKEIRVHFLVGLLITELLSNIESSDYFCSANYNKSVALMVLKYIEANYQTASLKDISNQLNSPNYRISKLLKEFTGKTFSELLLEKRVEKVVYLLKNTDYPIVEVINMVGYENASHFYKIFKDKYNMSLKSYREVNSI